MIKVSRRRLATYIAEQLVSKNAGKDMIQQVAAYLVQNKQADQVDLLLQDIATVMAEKHGVVFAQATTARPLNDEARQEILGYIASAEKAKTVELDESIDPDLIGGVVIQTPSALFDSSIRTQLRHLKSIKETRSK